MCYNILDNVLEEVYIFNMSFFAVHAIGGTNDLDRKLSAHLRPDYFLYKISPSVKLLNPGDFTIEELAAEYVVEIEEKAKPPYLLSAFCATGFIAIEMAKILLSQEIPVQGVLWFNPPNSFTETKKRSVLNYWDKTREPRMKNRLDKGLSQEQANQQLTISENIIKALIQYNCPISDRRDIFLFHPSDRTTASNIFDFNIFDKSSGLMNYLINAEVVSVNGKHGKLGEEPYCGQLAKEVKKVLAQIIK